MRREVCEASAGARGWGERAGARVEVMNGVGSGVRGESSAGASTEARARAEAEAWDGARAEARAGSKG